jgi:hypothetical protein
MDRETSLKLTDAEISAAFRDPQWCDRFPPVLTIEQAGDLLQMPVATLRDWRSRGLLKSCCRRTGKRVRFYRDRLLKVVFNDGL